MSERIVMGGDQRYKILNRDVIKYIAMFTMLLNHIAQGFLTNGTLVYKLMLSVGYFTAPVMLYFLVEGYIFCAYFCLPWFRNFPSACSSGWRVRGVWPFAG